MENIIYILSLPGSSSALLAAELDKRRGVVCMAESSFPQLLGEISNEERADPRRLAALYFGSTSGNPPLSFEDSVKCMSGSNEQILVTLGKATAAISGRDPAQVKHVVWWTSAMVGKHAGPLSAGGRFVVWRDNAKDVRASQPVDIAATGSRGLYRFALLCECYEHAYTRIPPYRKCETCLVDMQRDFPSMLEMLGVDDLGDWWPMVPGTSSASRVESLMCNSTMGGTARGESDLAMQKKHNQADRLERVCRMIRPVRCMLWPILDHMDKKTMAQARERAQKLLSASA